MTEKLEFYRCAICGNLVQIVESGVGELVCCNQPMIKLVPNSNDNVQIREKHTPVVEKSNNKTLVTLDAHPMEEEHYIQFIAVLAKDKSMIYLKYFKPHEKVELDITNFPNEVDIFAYCNIHGLWEYKS
jgi:superoxide reductase